MEGIKNIVSYSKLLRKKGMSFNSTNVAAFIPNPSEADYTMGYIERFFVQKINDKNAAITEVNQTSLISIQSTNYYNFVKISWKIKGSEEEIKKINKKTINNVNDIMPRLSLYLPNLLQFAKVD